MSFLKLNDKYENWLRKQCRVVEEDLDAKHKKMKKSSFDFLRATFFRWATQIEKICPELSKKAPAVLSVGDTHTENFGTWRDAEGRLVWGINDFDEAAVIPYPFDLVRLATSIRLAPDSSLGSGDAAEALLKGYRQGLAAPRPTLLDDQETWMRHYVACDDECRRDFWKEIKKYPDAQPPDAVADHLRASLPAEATILRFASRSKGGGSLGRPRYVAIAQWRGGQIVREAKALVPSAWDWAHKNVGAPIRFIDLATGRYRAPDPFLAVRRSYVLRRIAADSRKIELDADDAKAMELKDDLIGAMGFDLGALHAATDDAAAKILAHLESLSDGWLNAAAKKAAAAVEEDYQEWKKQ